MVSTPSVLHAHQGTQACPAASRTALVAWSRHFYSIQGRKDLVKKGKNKHGELDSYKLYYCHSANNTFL